MRCLPAGPDLRAGEKPQTMAEMVAANSSIKRNKPDTSLDWWDTCEVCGEGDVKGQTKQLTMCTHCEVVVHKDCIPRWHNDLHVKKTDDWTCPTCVRDIDSMSHTSSCGECNEAGAIVDDLHLAIAFLSRREEAAAPAPRSSSPRAAAAPAASSSSSSSSPPSPPEVKVVPVSEMLAARLGLFDQAQEKYHGHLIQDRNQAAFKNLTLDNMGVNAFYLLVDYWAKIGISKPGGVACCEGNSVGLSAHGSMFVYKNPTTKEREQISKEHSVDWSSFPTPSDQPGGLTFLEEHVSAYCDDAKQDQFHTKSVMSATITAFINARPWLGKERASFAQSDNAVNYRDPTIEVDCGVLGTRCFSVAGMGKDEGDGNGAVIKKQIFSKRSQGVQSASNLMDICRDLTVPAQTFVELNVNRSNDKQVIGRESFPRHYHLHTVALTSITYWEYLDPAASAVSIKETGRAVGYGPGVTEALTEFNKKRRSQNAREKGATLSSASSEGITFAPPKARPSRDEKATAAVAAGADKQAAEKKREENEAAELAVVESQYRRDIDVCPRCGVRFLSPGGFSRHHEAGCGKRTTHDMREQKRAQRSVAQRLSVMDDLAISQNQVRVRDLAVVKVILTAPNGQSAPIGIELEEEEGRFFVASVSGQALEAVFVKKGYLVVSIGDGLISVTKDALSGVLGAGSKLALTFRRPSPPIPFHGMAREIIHKEPRFVMHPRQLGWLKEKAYDHEQGRDRLRPHVAFETMQYDFRNMLRMDTKTPLWLEYERISKWIAEQKKETKQQKQQRGKKQKSSNEPKAKPKPKPKPKAPEAAAAAESDSEDESSCGSSSASEAADGASGSDGE